MVFDELVSEICERLDYTSDDAKSRVGREINARYRRITSSIGLETSRRTTVSAQATIGNRTMTFTGIEKIIEVVDKTDPNSPIVLSQITRDEMDLLPIREEPPKSYAVVRIHSNSVDIYVDCTPTTTFTLYADGHANLSTLSGNQAPDFPESFHDILIYGVMADEYRRMEKVQLMAASETDYERRLSDLRMWIAKSAYLDIHQGKYNRQKYRWIQPNTFDVP